MDRLSFLSVKGRLEVCLTCTVRESIHGTGEGAGWGWGWGGGGKRGVTETQSLPVSLTVLGEGAGRGRVTEIQSLPVSLTTSPFFDHPRKHTHSLQKSLDTTTLHPITPDQLASGSVQAPELGHGGQGKMGGGGGGGGG